MTTDHSEANQDELNRNASELQRRLAAAVQAEDSGHPGLTADPQVQFWERMRLHIEIR